MMLSIIIPHYNSPQKLKRLLESIFHDTDECQVIVVDDASTEGLDILENIKKEYSGRVEFYRNETGHKGAGSARNEGLKHITGQWVLFADADDYFMPGWYNAVLRHFDGPNDIVFFMPASVYEETGETAKRHVRVENLLNDLLNKKRCAELSLRYNHIVPWGKLIRTDVILDNNIRFEDVRYSNDVLFSAKAGFYAKNISVDPFVLYCVTDSKNTLTKATDEDALLVRVEEYCKENLFLKEHLSKNDYDMIGHRLGNLQRLSAARKRKCGSRILFRYLRLYRKYKVPVVKLFIREELNNLRNGKKKE